MVKSLYNLDKTSNDWSTAEWIVDRMFAEMLQAVPMIGNGQRNIRVLEPTPGEGAMLSHLKVKFALWDGIVYKAAKGDFFDMPVQKVDVAFVNPPFTPTKYMMEIMGRVFSFEPKVVVAVMPWLALVNSTRRMQNFIDKGMSKVIALPRRAFSGGRVQTCIVVIREGHTGPVVLETIV
jgi:hypothetical protein